MIKLDAQLALEPQFLYTISPESVYYTRDPKYPSVVTVLTIGIANNTGKDVPVEWIGLIFPQGDGAGDLVAPNTAATAVSLQPNTWGISGDVPTGFRVTPNPGANVLAAGASLSFEFRNLTVNSQPGPAVVTIRERSGGPATRTGGRPVTKIRSQLDITLFQAQPEAIPPGGTSTLTWTTTAAGECILVDSFGNVTPLPSPNGSTVVTPPVSVFYTLTASGVGPDVSATAQVAVRTPRILTWGVSPPTVNAGQPAVISWTTVQADSVALNPPGTPNPAPINGSATVSPLYTTVYTLTATGSGQTATVQPTISVNNVAVGPFTATPATGVVPGDATTLNWTTTSAASVSIAPSPGSVVLNGSCQVTPPKGSTTYTLTAQGQNGPQTAQVTVTTLPTGWAQATESAAFPGMQNPICWVKDGKMWCANPGSTSVWSSTDGINWTQVTNGATVIQNRGYTAGAAFLGKLWIISGGHNWSSDVWSSADGVTWNQVTNAAPFPWRFGHSVVVFKNQMLVIGGRGPQMLNDVWATSDGNNWTCLTANAGWSPRMFLTAVSWESQGQLWVMAGGDLNNPGFNDTYYSPDGATWYSGAAAPWPARSMAQAQVMGNQLYLMGGSASASMQSIPYGLTDCWILSPNGQWTQDTRTMPWAGVQQNGSLAFDYRVWVIGGFGASGGGWTESSVWYLVP